jgi:hypothetical protein
LILLGENIKFSNSHNLPEHLKERTMKKVLSILFTLLLTVAIAMPIAVPVSAHGGPDLISTFGTPVIDGVVNPGEWTGPPIPFTVNLPDAPPAPGLVYAMNDNNNLYIAIQFLSGPGDTMFTASIAFDNDHSGGPITVGDDLILCNFPAVFYDDYYDGVGFAWDVNTGGVNNGIGICSHAGGSITFEFSHPLDSTDDTHDFSLSPGNIAGFNISVTVWAGVNRADTKWPSTSMYIPDFFGSIILAAQTWTFTLEPDTASNPINTQHTVTATVLHEGQPWSGHTVYFEVTSGPNDGYDGYVPIDASGQASFTYTGDGGVGTDTIEASIVIGSVDLLFRQVEKVWTSGPEPTPVEVGGEIYPNNSVLILAITMSAVVLLSGVGILIKRHTTH